MKRWVSVLLVPITAFLLFTAAVQAFGQEEGEGAGAEGGCTKGSTWSLHMGREIGIGFEAGVETGVGGQRWRVILGYNGHILFRGVEVTEEDGGFDVIQVENNAGGEDVATWIATNEQTGESCSGKLSARI